VSSEQLTTQTQPITFAPVLSASWVLRWQHAVVCGCFVLLWLVLSYAPLSRTGAWVHVIAGRNTINSLSAGGNAATAPAMPLAEGSLQTPGAWASQVLIAATQQWGGAEALTWLFAVLQFSTLLLMTRVFYTQTGRKRLAMLALAAVIAAWWGSLLTLQPQVAGGLCLAVLLFLLAPLPMFQWRQLQADARLTADARQSQSVAAPPTHLWFALPVLMCVWANLDFSFIAGVVAVAGIAAGVLLNTIISRRSLASAISESSVQKWIYLAELSALATLLTPYGVDQWVAVLRPSNDNPLFVNGSGPLVLISAPGLLLTAGWLIAAVSTRFSKLPVHATAAVLLTGGSALVAWNTSLFYWVAPVVVLALLPYVTSCFHRMGWLQRSASEMNANWNAANNVAAPDSTEQPWRFAFTLTCGLLVWTGFALSPISSPLLGGKGRDASGVYDRQTPRAVAAFLKQKFAPPADNTPADNTPAAQKSEAHTPGHSTPLILAPAEYGDWLAYAAGSEHAAAAVFATSQFRRLPERVQGDYRKIMQVEAGWERLLDRYAVEVLVVDKVKQQRLFHAALRTEEPWDKVFEDKQAAVFTRRPEPLEATP